MTIAIDISPLQGPHRMRGIGSTLLNFINNISGSDRKKHNFILYMYPEDAEETLSLLNLKDINYITRPLLERRKLAYRLPGRLKLVNSSINQLIELRDLYLGDSRIRDKTEIDCYFQIDQTQSLPLSKTIKKVLFLHDLIPYVLERDYLWSYKTARFKGMSRKTAFRVHTRRKLYAHKAKVNARRANMLLANSEVTKADFIKYLGVSSKKIAVVPLGVQIPKPGGSSPAPKMNKYVKTSWGYLKRPFSLEASLPYVLYVGGADRRRKLDDLVNAYDRLRALGVELSMILVGDSMQGPRNIGTEEYQTALAESSYLDNIVFMGYVEDEVRDWLYNHAVAFIFPSKYEGFGLPVLEALAHGCPVVCYDNKASHEVAGNAPLYANNTSELCAAIHKLLQQTDKERGMRSGLGLSQAKDYSWGVTAKNIIKYLVE